MTPKLQKVRNVLIGLIVAWLLLFVEVANHIWGIILIAGVSLGIIGAVLWLAIVWFDLVNGKALT